jgi:hypothetical protein
MNFNVMIEPGKFEDTMSSQSPDKIWRTEYMLIWVDLGYVSQLGSIVGLFCYKPSKFRYFFTTPIHICLCNLLYFSVTSLTRVIDHCFSIAFHLVDLFLPVI